MINLTPRREDLDPIEIASRDEIAECFSDNAARVRAAADLKARIKRTVGVTVVVDVAGPGGVARSQGKAMRIVDNRLAR